MKAVQSLPRLVQSLERDERGSIMAWTALGLVSLLGMAALTVDMGYMYVLNNQLQTTADAAASAAAKELPDETAALAAAQDVVTKNMPVAAHGNVITAADVHFGNWDSGTRTFTDGGSPANAVRVNARRDDTNNNPARTFFASTLGFADVSIGAQAIAIQGQAGGPACLISLDPSSGDAFTLDSNASIDVTGCAVHINSGHSSALSLNSNSNVTADNILIAGTGDYDVASNAWVDPTPQTGAAAISDPLASLQSTEPTPAACVAARTNRTYTANATLLPGTYCGGIVIDGNPTITMTPGIYILKHSSTGDPKFGGGTVSAGERRAGTFRTLSNSAVNGLGGVFIFLTGLTGLNGTNPIIDFNSNTQVNLNAPTSGPYAGVVFYQDNALVGLTNRLDSNSTKNYRGAVYLPNSDILVDSNGSINTNIECSIFIARRFRFDSNAQFTGNFDVSAGCPYPWTAGLGGGGGSSATTLVK
jgi:Flp pilus assembly protein TadG